MDWHKQHPDKTFNDFAKIYCISEYDIEAQSAPAKKKNTPKILAIVSLSVFVLVALLGVTGYYGAKKFLAGKMSTKTSKSILAGSWKRSPIGNSGITLELPFGLEKQPVTFSDTLLSKIDTLESFAHVSDKGFKIATFYAAYKTGIEANLDAAVMGSVAEVEKLAGISDFKWNRTDTIVGNKDGAFVTMQYNLLVYKISIKAILVCDKNHLWQVVTQYSNDDETGRKASDRILSSIEVTNRDAL